MRELNCPRDKKKNMLREVRQAKTSAAKNLIAKKNPQKIQKFLSFISYSDIEMCRKCKNRQRILRENFCDKVMVTFFLTRRCLVHLTPRQKLRLVTCTWNENFSLIFQYFNFYGDIEWHLNTFVMVLSFKIA